MFILRFHVAQLGLCADMFCISRISVCCRNKLDVKKRHGEIFSVNHKLEVKVPGVLVFPCGLGCAPHDANSQVGGTGLNPTNERRERVK